MFAMTKQMRKDKKDIIGGYFVKGENTEIITTVAKIRERWKLYFDGLLNEENENEIEHVEPVEGPILDVTEEEVGRAVTSMKANKAPGPSGLSSDVLRAAGEPVVRK